METTLQFISQLLSKTFLAVLQSLMHNVLPLTAAILIAVFLKVYVNTDKVSKLLVKRTKVSIFASVLVGAFTPFCACGTTAVILGMLASELPWGPVMAFLTSSPLMDPGGFFMIAGVIGMQFAVALTISSVLIGIGSGFATHGIEKRTNWLKNQNRFSGSPAAATAACSCGSSTKKACTCSSAVSSADCGCAYETETETSCGCNALIENAPEQNACSCTAEAESAVNSAKAGRYGNLIQKLKLQELVHTFLTLGLKQILLNFSIFIAIGYLINYFIPTSIITALFGSNNLASVPLASLIGLPLYITTESGVPIIQSILASGASEGAMLAFMITGSATSAWVIAGLSTFLKKRAVALYVAFVLLGGILCGYLYNLFLLLAR